MKRIGVKTQNLLESRDSLKMREDVVKMRSNDNFLHGIMK